MGQIELERMRAENAQICQQLAHATAALDKVASSVRDLPKLQLPVGGSEKLPASRRSSGWVAAPRRRADDQTRRGNSRVRELAEDGRDHRHLLALLLRERSGGSR
jgi:hypothetical protein